MNDTDKLQFDSLTVGAPVMSVDKDYKNFDECLKPRNKGDRLKFCDQVVCNTQLS